MDARGGRTGFGVSFGWRLFEDATLSLECFLEWWEAVEEAEGDFRRRLDSFGEAKGRAEGRGGSSESLREEREERDAVLVEAKLCSKGFGSRSKLLLSGGRAGTEFWCLRGAKAGDGEREGDFARAIGRVAVEGTKRTRTR